MSGVHGCQGDPHHMTDRNLVPKPGVVDEYHHGPSYVERWEGAKFERRGGVDVVEEGVAQHSVQSEEASLTRVLVDDCAMAVDDGAVGEPGRGGRKEGLDEDSSEVHPPSTPHVGIELWSLCGHYGEVGSK